MAVNRVSITINSRQYTVVAEESREYIERLGEHINEKVKNVLNGGQNVLGERPIVLAALNICDEYFKALESDDSVKVEIEKLNSKIDNLKKENDSIKRELDDAKSGQVTIDETELNAELTSTKKDLETQVSRSFSILFTLYIVDNEGIRRAVRQIGAEYDSRTVLAVTLERGLFQRQRLTADRVVLV